MRLAIIMAGAAALGPVLGVVVSGAINTVPRQFGSDMPALLDSIPRHEEAPFDVTQSTSLPDHYPLVTPRGVVQVADLWLHGLYRNRSHVFGYDFEQEPYDFEVPALAQHPVAEDGAMMEVAPPGDGRELTAQAPAPLLGLPDQPPDTKVASVPLPVTRQVPSLHTGPKIVDVAAVLSAR